MPSGEDDVDRLLSDLARWAAESQTAQDAGARSREAWLRQQAADETSMEALLIGWAERAAWVRLTTVAETVDRARIVAVGRDFVLLNGDSGASGHGVRARLVRTSAIASVGRAPERGDSPGGLSDGTHMVRFETAPNRRRSSPKRSAEPDRPDELVVKSPPIDLAGVLAGLATERPRLRITTGPNSRLVGELRWVGSDVACLSLDGTPPTPAYVHLPGVIEVTILDR